MFQSSIHLSVIALIAGAKEQFLKLFSELDPQVQEEWQRDRFFLILLFFCMFVETFFLFPFFFSFESEISEAATNVLETAQPPQIVSDTLYHILIESEHALKHRYKVGGFLYADLPCLLCQFLPTFLMDKLFVARVVKPNCQHKK